jgi:uncharacterized protein (TIGR02284 family)
MAIDNEHVLSTLNGLIETCRDGQQGFQTALDAVTDSELKKLFHLYAQERAKFVAELELEVRCHGGSTEESGSIAATLHRGWMNIKSALTGLDEAAVIKECERGEDSAVKAYDDALRGELPADIRPVIERQAAAVREAHARLSALERARGAGA